MKVLRIGLALLVLIPCMVAVASEQDKQEIETTIKTYLEAFDKADAQALAAHWVENGDYVDASGHRLQGRDAIRQEYQKFFDKVKSPSLEITITSIYFANDDLVIEDGIREVTLAPNTLPNRIRYTAVHIKQEGKWLIQSVRDAVSFNPSNYDNLKYLEWAVGNWIYQDESGMTIQNSCLWGENRNFLIRNYTTAMGGTVLTNGTSWIGWDPVKKQVHSWVFDSNGSFGEGTWSREGDNKWSTNANTVLMSGKQIKETHVLTLVDNDSLQWETKDRTLDGNPLPDTEPIVMKRVP
jgi:uncharacterized protein (TIGR02246 family)